MKINERAGHQSPKRGEIYFKRVRVENFQSEGVARNSNDGGGGAKKRGCREERGDRQAVDNHHTTGGRALGNFFSGQKKNCLGVNCIRRDTGESGRGASVVLHLSLD